MVPILKRTLLWTVFVVLTAVTFAPAASLIDLTKQVKGTLPVANGGTGVTSVQGNGSKAQLSTGSTTTNDCVKFDANGNTVDAGSACAVSGAPSTSQYLLYTADGSLSNARVYVTPDIPPGSRNAMDEECNGASLNSPNNIWTWTNQGSTTETQGQGWCTLTFVSNGASHVARFIGQSLPSAPYTFVAKMDEHISAGFTQAGMVLFESGSGKWLIFGVDSNSGLKYSLGKSDGTVPVETAIAVPYPIVKCVSINRTSSTLTFGISMDCITFDTFTTRTVTTDFTTAPDTIGMGGDPYQQAQVLNFDYFRRTL